MRFIFITILCLSNYTLADQNLFSYPSFATPKVTEDSNYVKIKGASILKNVCDHATSLANNFEIQATTVTQSQYYEIMGTNPSRFQKRIYCPNDYIKINGISLCPNNPVENVLRADVQNFIGKLNSSQSIYLYRLPTIAESEYAARAGSQTRFWFGDDVTQIPKYFWFDKNSNAQTHSVDSKPANPFGLYDSWGNVEQFVSDFVVHGTAYCDHEQPGTPRGSFLLQRGGNWNSEQRYIFDDCYAACYMDVNEKTGFRLVRTPQ